MLYSAVSFLITLSNVAKFSMTYSVAPRSLSTTAELVVRTEFHMAVSKESVRVRPLNETVVAFLSVM